MMPATTSGLCGVGDDQHAAVEHAFLAVERDDLFAVGRAAHDDLLAADLRRVEGVHRLAVFQHHVVADIDDVVDRPQADRA